MQLSITSPQHRDRTPAGLEMLQMVPNFAHILEPGELLHKPEFLDRIKKVYDLENRKTLYFFNLVEKTSFLSISRLRETISIHY